MECGELGKRRAKIRSGDKISMFVVYILLCADNTYYIGSTSNITRRLYEHNHYKKGAKYTKPRRPVKLVYQEDAETIGIARSREAVLKKLTRKEKEVLIASVV